MTLRTVPILTLPVEAACAGEPAEEASPAEVAAAPSPDEQAIMALRSYYEEHFNLHHADMLAATYTEDAWQLPAEGGMREGRAAIQAGLDASMASSPSLGITQTDRLILGDVAVSMALSSPQLPTAGCSRASAPGWRRACSSACPGR